jgi:hypothetical protein
LPRADYVPRRCVLGAGVAMPDKLPRRIGLCPLCAPEFYYPLADGEEVKCPQCSLVMVVYEREDVVADLRCLLDSANRRLGQVA